MSRSNSAQQQRSNGFSFTKAVRRKQLIRLALAGPSGSGKTEGALALARAFAGPAGKIAVIDTEHDSALVYADRYDFDHLSLTPPYTTARYLEAFRAAVDAKYDVLVIDTISHQWVGTGGILARKDELDSRGREGGGDGASRNGFANWMPFTREHERFREAIMHAPIHVIATMRSKSDYVLEQDERGRQVPKKVGMAPIQREGFEYEFTTVLDLGMDHLATVTTTGKDRTRIFAGQMVDLLDVRVGARLREWAEAGDQQPSSSGGSLSLEP
jgi:DNA polymerase III delta prime subunit